MNTAALFRICVGLLAVSAFNESASAQQQQKSSAPPAAAQQKNSAPAQHKNSAPLPRNRKNLPVRPIRPYCSVSSASGVPTGRHLVGRKSVSRFQSRHRSAANLPGRTRDAAYAFVSTRPSEKVKNEVSVIVGYPQRAGHDASAAVGSSTYAMYTQNDGAWVKNAAEEAADG